MKIRSIHLHPLSIPLNFQFKQSNNSGTSQSLSAIVELQTEDGLSGYGESCPRVYVTGEKMTDVADDIERIRQEILHRPIATPEELKERIKSWGSSKIGPSTRCALELAWLDAWSRSRKKVMPEFLPVSYREELGYSLVLPLLPPALLGKTLERLAQFRPPAVKLKAGDNQKENLARIKVLQSHFGEDLPIRLDVNAGWSQEEAKNYIPQMLAVGVHSFEQPLAPADHAGLKQLTAEFGGDAQIMADETLLDLESAEKLIREKICNRFNLKISKLGGLFSSLEIYELAHQNGIPCQLGAHFGETSLLTSAGALLAGIVGGKLTNLEGALGEFLLSRDIAQPCIQHDFEGSLALDQLWQKPGLVDAVLDDRIKNFVVSTVS